MKFTLPVAEESQKAQTEGAILRQKKKGEGTKPESFWGKLSLGGRARGENLWENTIGMTEKRERPPIRS